MKTKTIYVRVKTDIFDKLEALAFEKKLKQPAILNFILTEYFEKTDLKSWLEIKLSEQKKEINTWTLRTVRSAFSKDEES